MKLDNRTILGISTIITLVVIYLYLINYKSISIILSVIPIIGYLIAFYNHLFNKNEIKCTKNNECLEYYYNNQIKKHINKYQLQIGEGIFKYKFNKRHIDSFDHGMDIKICVDKGEPIQLEKEEDWELGLNKDFQEVYIKNSSTIVKEFKRGDVINIQIQAIDTTAQTIMDDFVQVREGQLSSLEDEEELVIEVENLIDIPIYSYELYYEIPSIKNLKILKMEHRPKERTQIESYGMRDEDHSIIVEFLYSKLDTISDSIYEQASYLLKSTIDLDPGILYITINYDL